jgi:hypothetical protein
MVSPSYAIWVHGSSLNVQDPNAFKYVIPVGHGIQLHGKFNAASWIHFAIPTPCIIDSKRPRIDSIMFILPMLSNGDQLVHVHIYDGNMNIGEYNNVSLIGNVGVKAYDIPDHPELHFGINIALYIQFGINPFEPHMIEFVAAGCNLIL